MKVIQTCAFGEDYEEKKVQWKVNGKLETTTLGFCLRRLFEQCFNRFLKPQVFLFPELIPHFRLSGDSDIVDNALLVRRQIREMIQDRRAGRTKSRFEGTDLLSILLSNEIF